MERLISKTSFDYSAFRVFLPKDWRALLVLAAGLGLLPCCLPNDYFLMLFNIIALNALVVLGLNLLICSTGQVSLGHAAFYGMGAYLSAIASTTWQWPLAASFAFALLLVGLTSYLLALPTLRLEGHYLVMATLGFNIIVNILLGHFEGITGGPSGFPGIPRLHFASLVLGTDRSFYYFIWTVFLIVFALTINLVDSRMGRALRSIHEKELTAQALGIPTHRYKVVTFVLSALYAAVAGFCYAHYVTFISPKTFDIFYSVQIVTMVVVGGLGSIWGGLVGVALLTALPELLHRFEDLHTLFYGLILTGVLVFCRQGLVPTLVGLGRLGIRWNRQAGSVRTESPGRKPPDRPAVSARSPGNGEYAAPRHHDPVIRSGPVLVNVQDISMSFGGLQALHEVSLDVYPGEIVALIGPNGAGKTTLLNIICGLWRPQAGRISLRDIELTRLTPWQIAACGVGRTFQATQIYPHFSVLENILLGLHVHGRSGFCSSSLHTGRERGEEKELHRRALALLDDFEMADKASLPSQALSLLEHKLLEIARAQALSPSVLLLDEPVGGLNPRESEVLVERIASLRRRGLGMILVEHDMNVVMRLADRVVVLQHGSRIALGTPGEIQSNPRVVAAYLGMKRPA